MFIANRRKMLIVLTGLTAFAVYFITFYQLTHDQVEKVEISSKEQDAIELFYKTNPEIISRGEYFDVKYTYFDPVNLSDAIIEIVKKKQVRTNISDFTTKDKKEKLISYIKFDPSLRFDLEKSVGDLLLVSVAYDDSFKSYGRVRGSTIFHDIYYLYILNSGNVIYYDFEELTLIIKVNGKEEKHQLKFNLDKQLETAKIFKDKLMSEGKGDTFTKVQTNYYFGMLFQKDFYQWFEEITIFLNSDIDKKNIDITTMTHLFTNCNSKEELKVLLELNDEQFDQYLRVIQLAKEKEISEYIPEYLR